MPRFSNREIAQGGLIAGLYVGLTLVLHPISFGVYQLRIAEVLTVTPFLSRAAVPGLFVGCLLANTLGGMGWQDVIFGSLLTLVAALLTRLTRKISRQNLAVLLAPLPPVIVNAFGVSAYLAPLLGLDYWFSVQMVGIGEIGACYLLGLPVLLLLRERRELFA